MTLPYTTLFNPTKESELSADILAPRGVGISGTATAGQSTNIDYQVPEDRIFAAGFAILVGQVAGDSMSLQVVDKDGLVFPAGTVIATPFSSWCVTPDQALQHGMEAKYPSKVMAGFYLRCVYVSTGIVNVKCYFNLMMHKVLA